MCMSCIRPLPHPWGFFCTLAGRPSFGRAAHREERGGRQRQRRIAAGSGRSFGSLRVGDRACESGHAGRLRAVEGARGREGGDGHGYVVVREWRVAWVCRCAGHNELLDHVHSPGGSHSSTQTISEMLHHEPLCGSMCKCGRHDRPALHRLSQDHVHARRAVHTVVRRR